MLYQRLIEQLLRQLVNAFSKNSADGAEVFYLRKGGLQLFFGQIGTEHLVFVRAHDEYRRVRCMTRDRGQPEVEAGVLKSQTGVPQQQVNGAIRQEELRL